MTSAFMPSFGDSVSENVAPIPTGTLNIGTPLLRFIAILIVLLRAVANSVSVMAPCLAAKNSGGKMQVTCRQRNYRCGAVSDKVPSFHFSHMVEKCISCNELAIMATSFSQAGRTAIGIIA
jgi:hypothetical protein